MSDSLPPGLAILHGNRLELLRDAVFDFVARHPLDPLEEEIFLVQSNGAAEWLKMEMAKATGVCAATRVELPGRFLWRAYRRFLGRERLATQSPLDKEPLTWRLMRVLASVDGAPFEPVVTFLADGDAGRRLQLARQLADLYDQYQVYRADWLDAWARGRDVLLDLDGRESPLPKREQWQAALWRMLRQELSADERAATRPAVHRAFLDAIESGSAPVEPLPRRVILFGASHLSSQTLEALAALSTRVQMLFAIPNPSRYHWADIIDGREGRRLRPPRHPWREGTPLTDVPPQAMHAHANPLLAAWGKQGRDFMRLLDRFDDVERVRGRFDLPRTDLFDEAPGRTLLESVQSRIRDLVPVPRRTDDRETVADADRSIVFHIAHGPQREVEVLHDQLLALFAAPSDRPLGPRDVIVMVPDIERFAPSVRAVFGQYDRPGESRFIPFEIADLKSRGSDALMVAIEWLLRIREKRARLTEIRDLLDVPAIAACFGIGDDEMPRLFAWLSGAGVRWGLDAEHRARLGLGAVGEVNSWLFGLRRMLLGYASGDDAAFAGVEPYDEIGGLDAASVGALAEVIVRVEGWWHEAGSDATPRVWAERGRALLDRFVAPTDERERLTLAALQGALTAWLEACDAAGFEERVPVSMLREAWLSGVEGLSAGRRFLAGGVTFCTLLPLRAVPFRVVCLLGMGDGMYPRVGGRNDFDLMALPTQQRPGDRSRRDDDRYLMLEALLSARDVLYISWAGHNPRDNSAEPPSVLVAQLRDYLAASWTREDGSDVLAGRTTDHPLQPFSRSYFEAGGLTTYAREWRKAHATVDAIDDESVAVMPPFDASEVTLRVQQLVRFLKNPAREFFRIRLGVVRYDDDDLVTDDEAFAVDGLEQHRLLSALIDDPGQVPAEVDPAVAIAQRRRRIAGSGRLPLFESGTRLANEIADAAAPMLVRWSQFHARWPHDAPRVPLRFEVDGLVVDDWLDNLRSDGASVAWVRLTASKLKATKKDVRADKLLGAWVEMLLASACGHHALGVVIGCDIALRIEPIATARARTLLKDLVRCWREGMDRPLPFAPGTAIAIIDGKSARQAYEGGFEVEGEREKQYPLARVFPDYESLAKADGHADLVQRLFGPLREWTKSSVHIVNEGEPLAPLSIVATR